MRAPDAPGPRASDNVLEIGGRLEGPPSQQLVATAFSDELENQRELFGAIGLADLAHTLVMQEAGVIPDGAARDLLHALLILNKPAETFEADAAKGDIYTNREAWLQSHTRAAGWLGVSRARREAVTTGYHIAVRANLLDVTDALCGLAGKMAELGSKHSSTLFPDYTYLQAAQPTTFGHYLLAFAHPILRHLDRAAALYERFNLSPAGGGSANGSIAPQDRIKLARALGFDGPLANTRDAMWQADLAIEAAALVAGILITLDRLGEDLMVYATQEFGLVQLGDRHSRASKIMPQKKNPFALSYLRGIANQAIGLQAAITAAMRTPSGQMDNRMAAYGDIPAALRQAAQAARLMEEVLADLKVDNVRAREIVEGKFLASSDLAEHIMLATGLDFRQAHKLVGALVRELESGGESLADAEAQDLDRIAIEQLGRSLGLAQEVIARALDPNRAIEARGCLGGAAPKRVKASAGDLKTALAEHRRASRKRRGKVEAAERKLVDRAENLARPA